MDEARDCLNDCHDKVYEDDASISLLEYCLDDDGKKSKDQVDNLEDLSDCCGFDRKDSCEDTLSDAQQCLDRCLHPCLSRTTEAWYECVDDETGKKGCSRDECLDEFLGKAKDSASGDLYDFENIEHRVEKLAMDKTDDCSLLEDFVDTACDAGKDCCDKCQRELAATIDCVINDVVIPFVGDELGKTLPECPISTKCKEDFPKRRDLLWNDEAGLLFNKALNLPASSTSQEERIARREDVLKRSDDRRRRLQTDESVSRDIVAQCQSKMKFDVLAYNMTHAANNYITCVNAAVFAVLEDPAPDSGVANLVSAIVVGLGLGVSTIFLLI